MLRKLLLLATIILLVVTSLLLWEDHNSEWPSKELQQRCQLEIRLHTQAQVGDFLEFKDGSLGLITKLIPASHLEHSGCHYKVSPLGKEEVIDYHVNLARQVSDLIEKGTPEWEAAARSFGIRSHHN